MYLIRKSKDRNTSLATNTEHSILILKQCSTGYKVHDWQPKITIILTKRVDEREFILSSKNEDKNDFKASAIWRIRKLIKYSQEIKPSFEIRKMYTLLSTMMSPLGGKLRS